MEFDYGLYPVITKEFCKGRSIIDVLKSVINGGVKIVQYRDKSSTKKEIFNTAIKFREITSNNDVKLIINDHLDIALAVNADGIHLGQEDLPCKTARILAPKLIIGVSTHNLEEIKNAENDGASYINIGPLFKTNTKKLKYPPLGLDYLKSVKTHLPFSVMGGIKMHNIKSVIQAGARNIAMITEITEASNVMEQTRKIVEIIKSYSLIFLFSMAFNIVINLF